MVHTRIQSIYCRARLDLMVGKLRTLHRIQVQHFEELNAGAFRKRRGFLPFIRLPEKNGRGMSGRGIVARVGEQRDLEHTSPFGGQERGAFHTLGLPRGRGEDSRSGHLALACIRSAESNGRPRTTLRRTAPGPSSAWEMKDASRFRDTHLSNVPR